MKQLLPLAFITLLVLGTACAWISPSSQTTSDGIQVHGHWTVTVTNPDGSVDAVHEFDNRLHSEGKKVLRDLILGERDVTGYGITLSRQTGSPSKDFDCKEDARPDGTPNDEELVATATKNPDNSPQLTISATCTVSSAQEESAIWLVRTYLKRSGDLAHDWNTFNTLTEKMFSDPDSQVPVKFGQIISFNVVISFE